MYDLRKLLNYVTLINREDILELKSVEEVSLIHFQPLHILYLHKTVFTQDVWPIYTTSQDCKGKYPSLVTSYDSQHTSAHHQL